MTDLNAIARNYVDAWNEADAARRTGLIEAAFTQDVSYCDPIMQGDGHGGMTQLIEGVQQRFPGFRFTLRHAGRLRRPYSLFVESRSRRRGFGDRGYGHRLDREWPTEEYHRLSR